MRLNVNGKKINSSLLLLLILPFFSTLVMNTIFSLFYLCLIWFYYSIKQSRILWIPLLGLFFIIIGSVLSDIQLFIFQFFDFSFISHRSLRNILSHSIVSIVKLVWYLFITEKYTNTSILHHVIIFWGFILLPILIIYKSKYVKTILLILLAIIINNIFSVLLFWDVFDPLKIKFSFIRMFDFTRFTNLNPFYWWFLFAFIIKYLHLVATKKYSQLFSIFIISAICISGLLYVLKNSWLYRENFKHAFIYEIDKDYNSNCMSIKNYYSQPLFNEIKEYIGKEQFEYKVGSIGLHPAVTAYNGFYTIDGYSGMYSLDYKIKFREIIEPELRKYPSQSAKFDSWGNRCYLFSSELLPLWNHKDYIISKYSNIEINNLEFDFEKMKQLPCHYIFSTVEINNYSVNHIYFERSFEHKDFPYRIYLYKLI